jgi:uncharacterized protein
MLLRLKAENFNSIDQAIEFSMQATKETQHCARVAEDSELPVRVLQTAAIWGPNASGKSNFCKLLMFVQSMVVDGTRPDGGIPRHAFRLRRSSATEPSRFEFDLLVGLMGNEQHFRYTFSLTEKKIVHESLIQIRSSTERLFFSRDFNAETNQTEWNLDWWKKKSISARFVARGTKDNQLFLHEAMDRNLEILAPVYRWFRDQLIVVQPDDDFLTLTIHEPERAELRKYAAGLLGSTGSGITGIEAIEVSANAMGIPSEVRNKMLEDLKNDEGGVIVRSSDGDRFSVFRKDGDLVTSRLITFRTMDDGTKVPFELSEESDGTRRVFDLSPLFHELDSENSNKVFVIDEFDRSMHGLLSRALLKNYFSTRSQASRAQLIFTTHDLMLMDQSLLRRDEMWFVDRTANGATIMNRLSEQKNIRYDKDIRKAYLDGLFAALPVISQFARRESQLLLPGLDYRNHLDQS